MHPDSLGCWYHLRAINLTRAFETFSSLMLRSLDDTHIDSGVALSCLL